MIKGFMLTAAFWLIASSAYAACVLETNTGEQNFTHCLQQAEKGDAEAQLTLAVMFYEGNGVAQDYDKAVQWYVKSAEQGNISAQASLGMLYARGVGIAEDKVSALMWMNIADANGFKQIAMFRNSLLSTMNTDQKEQAKFLAEVWMEKH